MKNIYNTLGMTKACLCALAISLVTTGCSDLLDKGATLQQFLMVVFGLVKGCHVGIDRMLSFPDWLVA